MVSAAASFRAVVNLTGMPGEEQYLKRLALIFDEIYYVPPTLYVIEEPPSEDPGGNFRVDFFEHCVPYVPTKLAGLQETLLAFEEAGIARRTHTSFQLQHQFDEIQKELLLADLQDEEFRKLSQDTSGSAPARRFKATLMSGPQRGAERELLAIQPPNSIVDSLILTNTLYIASRESLFPVFLEPRHRLEMQYRYEQYKQESNKLYEQYPELVSPVNFATQLGEITFSIFENVMPHEKIADRSAEDIIKYRNDMAPARKKYVASLTEFSGMAENNPWNQRTRDQVKKYLVKLAADLETYRYEAANIRQKMFDDLGAQTADAIVKSAAGALTGSGLSGILAPQVSSFGLMMAGALLASSKMIPKLVKTVLDFRRACKEHKCSSIAYIAEFK